MKLFIATLGLVAGLQSSFVYAQDDYLDDRSSPEVLLSSLYNAINRKEYARAYSYFSTPPAASIDDYAQGYANTERVALLTGTPMSEGAAGSIFYSLPVAIRATGTDGNERVFAGCYTLRLANPQIQGSPFQPLHIEDASLESAQGELPDVLPANCGEGEAAARDGGLAEAKALFNAAYGRRCQVADDEQGDPDIHVIPFNYSYEDAGTPPHEARLFRFYCDRGAYNELHIYALENEEGGISLLEFATPELDIRYMDDDSEGPVDDIQIIGYTAEDQLVNSGYDPETLTITSHAKWRGVGDAFSGGTWLFREGTFSLVRYQADASYDGEINPVLLLDYFSGP